MFEPKDLDNENMDQLKSKCDDVKIYGDPGKWELICKASSQKQGWMKSTKRMAVEGGHIYQTTSEYVNSYGQVIACSDSLVFVPRRVVYLSEEMDVTHLIETNEV